MPAGTSFYGRSAGATHSAAPSHHLHNNDSHRPLGAELSFNQNQAVASSLITTIRADQEPGLSVGDTGGATMMGHDDGATFFLPGNAAMNFVKDGGGLADGAVANSLLTKRVERKWPISYRAVETVANFTDVVIIFSASILTGVIYHLQSEGTFGTPVQYIGSAAVVAALFVSLMRSSGMYNPTKLLDLRSQLQRIAFTWCSVFLLLAGVVFALKIGKEFSRGATLSFAAVGLTALIVQRTIWRGILMDGLARNKFLGRKIALITDRDFDSNAALLDVLTSHGFRLERRFMLPLHGTDSRLDEEVISRAIAQIRGSDIEEVFVSADLLHWSRLKTILSELQILPLPVNLVPKGAISEILKHPSYSIGKTVSVEWQRSPLTAFERAAKRMLDILCAGTGLILLLPLLTLTAIAIKLDSPGPIMFRQRRCGFNGKIFQILKFRTMSVLEDGDSITQAARSDTRITRLGKWLRRTSIDELPQLINVLSGSMSIVGPRPHAAAHDNEFDKVVQNYAFRHHMKPGLTGWAQVNGHRGQTPTVAHMERRVELDLWYIDNWSLGLDLAIMFRTLFELARGENAY
jgi:Undecaprenyl-phosphate glucose phosphotransferase